MPAREFVRRKKILKTIESRDWKAVVHDDGRIDVSYKQYSVFNERDDLRQVAIDLQHLVDTLTSLWTGSFGLVTEINRLMSEARKIDESRQSPEEDPMTAAIGAPVDIHIKDTWDRKEQKLLASILNLASKDSKERKFALDRLNRLNRLNRWLPQKEATE